MRKMNVNFVSFDMPQHARHSGYAQLVRYINGRQIDLKDNGSFLRFVPLRLKNKIVWDSGLVWFTKDRLATECYVILNMITKPRAIFHFPYAENSYRYSGWFSKIRGQKIIGTYHLPPSIFPDKIRHTEHIRRLDALIVVARNQIDFLAQYIPREKIFFIPHGIDTDFFHPSIPFAEREDNICLFVGNFLRDFKTFKKVMRIVHSKNNVIQFVVITRQENFKHFRDEKNIVLKTKLEDEELLHYYQKATLFLQCMEDCTANNSVLESLACGLPMVVTDIGGIRDYVDESSAVLVPAHNPERMAEIVLTLWGDKTRLEQMSERSRQKALEFSWSKIVQKMERVYQKVSAG